MGAVTSRLIVGAGTPESRWQAWFARRPPARCDAVALVRPGAVFHVVAPHPDDEVLGCGGMLHRLSRLGVPIRIWAVTDGEASHPGSPAWPPRALARCRTRESEAALALLAPGAVRTRLGVPDGQVEQAEHALAGRLADGFAPGDTVVAPWRLDGHPDHEAAARAGRCAAQARGCRFLEAPIWGWHWADPRDEAFPWRDAVAVPLGADALRAKKDAIRLFRSQLQPDPAVGQPPVLPDYALERLQRPFEVILR